MCTLGFEGKGYSPEFVAGYQRIADSLRVDPRGDETPIRVAAATDSICEPCPNRQGIRCTSEPKIQALDRAHAEVLGLAAGQVLSWGEAKSLIGRKMTIESFERACAPCAWKAMGVCEKALRAVQAKYADSREETEKR
jgi:hypothetical protein